MIKNQLLKVTVLSFSLLALPVMAQKTLHVNISNGDDGNDGLKWSTAFKNIQPAIDAAVKGDTIKVAKGTYFPTNRISGSSSSLGDRDRCFLFRRNIKIYGGFPAGATDITTMNDRNWEKNITILSGDFNNDDGDNFKNTDENAYHVVVMLNATAEMQLDGFYITGGNGNSENSVSAVNIDNLHVMHTCGGGIYAVAKANSSPTLSNLVIRDNKVDRDGGGLYLHSDGGDVSPTLTNVSMINNVAKFWGGAYYSKGKGATPKLKNVIITGNESVQGGGLICMTEEKDCSPEFENVLISGNKANKSGGIFLHAMATDARPVFINTTICGNKATTDYAVGGIYILSTSGEANPYIKNTVIWGNKSNLKETDNIYTEGGRATNPVYTNSFIEGTHTGGTNLNGNMNPMFVNHIDADFAPTVYNQGDYRLYAESPLINKGDNSAVSLTKDLAGQDRIYNNTVDIGAYESKYNTSSNEAIVKNNPIWSYQGNLYVKINNNTATMCAYSINGILVKQINNLGDGTHALPMPEGLYIIKLSTGESAKVLIKN